MENPTPEIAEMVGGKRDKNYNFAIELQRKGEIERWFKEVRFNNPKHITKYLFWKRFGFYTPRMTFEERKNILAT